MCDVASYSGVEITPAELLAEFSADTTLYIQVEMQSVFGSSNMVIDATASLVVEVR